MSPLLTLDKRTNIDSLRNSISLLVRSSAPTGLSVAYLVDIDRFQRINASLGHEAGDHLLVEVGRRLGVIAASLISEYNVGRTLLERIGSDQYIVVLSEIKDKAHAGKIGRRLMQAFLEEFQADRTKIILTGCIGYAIFPNDTQVVDDLLRLSETAIAHAKANGRNRLVHYEREMQESAERSIRLEHDIAIALEEKQFFLVYQPQVCMESEAVVSYEALIRWYHPTRGIIPPNDFIGDAERSGQISQIGDWVLEEACLQSRSWIDKGLRPCRIAVNLSAQQFEQPWLVNRVEEIISKTGLPPDLLELEITENMIMADFDQTRARLLELRELEVHLAIDDFGTGYSNLSYLTRFPVDTMKIDRSFVSAMSESPADRALAESVILLGKSLGVTLVAEGVETQEQAEILRAAKCNLAQGYLYGKPACPTTFKPPEHDDALHAAKSVG